ncbi:MAG TPA: hypothetical protein VMM58_12290 [Bacteroidota bacterium]|nr:hypothetical protein [Bacteroidota bacterium]
MPIKIYRSRLLKLSLVIIAMTQCGIPLKLAAQPGPASPITAVLLNGVTNGLTPDEANSFFSRFQQKLSRFPEVSVSLKSDLAARLNEHDRNALGKCSTVSCVQLLAEKAGFQRVLLCQVTKKGFAYEFHSYEFDVHKPQQLSAIADNAVCHSAGDVEKFITKVATEVGQSMIRHASSPQVVQESKSNVWWYVGTAATLGVAAGVYYFVEHKKENSASPTSLPDPPNFP